MRGNNQFSAPWSTEEDNWLREHYPASLPDETAAALPGRTILSIQHRASRLGIRKSPDVIAAMNSRTNKGRVRSTENRAKISEGLTGKKQSDATRQKRRQTHKKIAKFGRANPNWKETVTEDQSRWRARHLLSPGPCARCEKPGTDVHHKDENPHNNTLDNLVRLCAKHHRQEHAKLDREKQGEAPPVHMSAD